MINVLHDIVTTGSERFADATAFRWKDETLSYADLEARTARLARTLQACGVRRGDRVGIFMRKGIETPIALFAAMRAGAAYVPLDVSAPAERVAGLVRDCSIRVIVTTPQDKKATDALVALVDSELIVVGTSGLNTDRVRSISWPEVDSQPPTFSSVAVRSEDLAYIMYTSGSTGLPKGIMHTHSSGLAYATAAADLYAIGPDDRLANHSPIHFDMSTFDYFSGPLRGASTTILSTGMTRMPASMSSVIEKDRLTIWYSVPLALVQLMQHGLLDERDCSSIRWVLFGGEPFPVRHLRNLMDLWPQAGFANVYGPAEVNQCTHYSVPRSGWAGDQQAVPLGEMWSAARGLVVNESGKPVSQSTVGELLVETATMMKGYWNRDDLTDAAIEVREDAGHTGRYYRTGDLVYRNEQNQLVFVGRKDHQIKTRGYRVELTEIEAALLQYEGVAEAAAFPIEHEPGTTLVAAAVIASDANGFDAVGADAVASDSVASDGIATDTVATDTIPSARPALAPTEILAHLRSVLPAYAVPAEIHVVTTLPRTGTGKVDRVALRQLFTHTIST
jgi:amino acid adenylation domain-containing protein